MLGPPVVDRIAGKFRGVATGANLNVTLVQGDVIEAVRNGNAFC